MRSEHPLAWLPPFMVGLSAVVAAEFSLGLLLYTGPRLLPSLTVILVTLLGALALGLWSAPRADSMRLVEAVRRRWLLALLSFVVAASTAGAWSALGGLASLTATRGMGLAFLAGLPLFACGTVLGAIGVTRPGRAVGVAAAASLGGATGAVFTGFVLVHSLLPVSMYVFCLVALSAGALVHGRVLDRRSEDRLVDEETSLLGTVRVTERIWGSPRRRQRRMTVGGRFVGGTEDGAAIRPWEEAVATWVTGSGAAPSDARPVLVVGASAVSLQKRLRAVGLKLLVVERNPVVWRMTVRHFGVPRSSDGLTVETGDPMDVPLDGMAGFGMVVVDGAGTSPGDALPLPSAALLRRLRRVLPPDGTLVLGGDDPGVLRGKEALRALRELLDGAGFPKVRAFGGQNGNGPGRVLVVAGGAEVDLPGRVEGMDPLDLPERGA